MRVDINLQTGTESRHHQIQVVMPGAWPPAEGRIHFVLDGEAGEADWAEIAAGVYSILLDGYSHELHITAGATDRSARVTSYEVTAGTRRYHVEIQDPRRRRHAGAEEGFGGPQEVMAPMPGRIVKVLVTENQEVTKGDGLLVIEAMKMQNELRAVRSGRVEKIYVSEGTGVEMAAKLLRLS